MSNNNQAPKRPTSFDELFPGRFLKAGLLQDKPRTLKIRDVTLEELPSNKGPDQVRGIISFEGTPLQLCLNKTNGVCLRAMFGNKPLAWIGKRVTLVPEKDKFDSETVDAIRIQGSPDIAEAMDVEIRMPRKKPKRRRLLVTSVSRAGNGQQQREPAPKSDPEPHREPENEPEPPPDDDDDLGPEPPAEYGQQHGEPQF